MRPSSVGLLFCIFLAFLSEVGYGQATFSQARHETLSQTQIDVTFNQTVTVGATPTAGWSVTLNGNAATVSSVTQFGTTAVRITINASTTTGHTGSEPFILPTESINTVSASPSVGVRVNYDNSVGTLSSAGGVNSIVSQQSFNNTAASCTELLFYQQGQYATEDNCVPVVMNFTQYQFRASLRWRNSSTYILGTSSGLQYNIAWGDATFSNVTPYQSNAAGVVDGTFIEPSAFSSSPGIILTARPTHSYPSSTTPLPDICSWDLFLRPLMAGASCNSLAQTTIFNNWDTDNANTGTLNLPYDTPGVGETTNQVCQGTNVNMQFSDQTSLNCRTAAPEANKPNQLARNIRITYGSTNYAGPDGNIPDVFVTLPAILGGTTTRITNNDATGTLASGPFFPVSIGVVADFNGVITLAAPVTVSSLTTYMGQITTTDATKQKVGQRLYVKLEYWDICNPYDIGNPTNPAPVSVENYVEIVGKPTVAVATDKNFCYNEDMTTTPAAMPASCTTCFEVTSASVAGNTEIKWYSTLADAAGDANAIVNDYGSQSVFLRPSETVYRASTAGTVAGIPNGVTAGDTYSVWVRYRTGTVIPNNCLSEPVEVKIVMRKQLDLTGQTVTPSVATICRGTGGSMTFSLPAGLPDNPNPQSGFNTKYTWTLPANWTLVSGQGTKVLTASPDLTATPGTNTISVIWEYQGLTTAGGTNLCPSGSISGNVTVLQIPIATTNPPNRNICEDGTHTFNAASTTTNAGGPFTFQWEYDVDGAGPGGFVSVPTAVGDAFSGETTGTLTVNLAGLSLGTTYNNYRFRAAITGTCGPGYSNFGTLTVNAKPKISTNPTDKIICQNGNTSFSVVATGQPTLSYLWEVNTGSGFTTVSNGGPYSGLPGATLNVNTNGTGSTLNGALFRVTVGTSGTQCNAFTAQSTSATLTLQGPTVGITNGATASVCTGNSLPIVATETFLPGSIFASRVWSGTFDSDGSGPTAPVPLTSGQLDALLTDGVGGSRRTALDPIFNTAATGVYVLTLTTTDDNICTNAASITITVSQLDAGILYGLTAGTVTNSTLNASICSGSNLFLNGNPSGGSGTYTSHNWTKISGPGGVITTLLSSATVRNPTFSSAVAGTYVLGYSVADAAGGGCTFNTDPTKNITIVVNPLPTVVNQTPTAVCSTNGGGNTSVVDLTTLHASINNSGTVTFDWFTDSGLTSSIASPTTATITDGTAVYVRVRENASPNCFSVATATYTVRPKANIAGPGQPVNAAICDLGNTSFVVTATGTDLSYQWQEDPDGAGAMPFADIIDGGVYSGATSTTLTLTAAPASMNARVYRAVVTSFTTSPAPSCPITSNSATLAVNAYPGITTHPANDAKCLGLNASFTVAATGTGLTYRWQIDADGPGAGGFVDLADGGVYSNTATATLTITGVTAPLNGAFYRVRISRATSCSIDSNPATLTVNPLPTSVTINPVLCDEIPGGALNVSSVTLSAYNASVTNAPTVVWYSDALRTTVVTTPPVTHNQIFYWRSTSALTCINVGQVQFTVEDLPDAIDKAYSFCEDAPNAGTASNIDLTALEFGAAGVTNGDGTAATRNVVWFSDAAYSIPIDNPGTVALNEETDFTITATTTVYARVINTSSASTPDCFDDAVITLVYKPMPVTNGISGDATLCSSAGIVKVYSVNATTNNYGALHNYTWSINGGADNFEVFVAGTGFITTNSYLVTTPDNLIIVMFPNPGNFHFEVYETIDGCTGDINDYDVSVTGAPTPLAFALPTATQVCKDQTGVTYSLSTPPLAGSTYTWTVIGGTVVGASSGLGLGTITVNWGSNTLPQPKVTVTETNSNGCSSAPATVNITLNDVPSITSPNTSLICSGSTPNTAVLNPFTANIGGMPCTSCTFSWKVVNATANVTSGGLQIPVFPSAGSTGSGNNIPISMINTSGVNGTVIFEVTAIENDSPNPPTCGSTTQTFTVTIKPEPVVNTVSNIVVCSGDAISAINFAGNAGGETFNWVNDNNTIGLSAGSSGSINGFTAADNFDATDLVANITVTATKNGCISAGTNSKTFTITIHPEPVYNSATPTVCSDGALGLNLTTLKNGLGVNATAFNITNINTNGLAASAGSPATGNGLSATAIGDDAWTNTTNNPVNVIYTIVPVAGTCLGDAFTVQVTVTPEPVYNNSSPIRCSDEAVNLNLSSLKVGSSVAATTFSITSIVDNGLVASAGSPAVASGLASNVIMDDAWTNVTNSPVNVVYTIVPMNGTCPGTAFTVTISVSPEPVYANALPTVCSDGLVGIDFNTLKNASSITASAFNITNIVDNGLTASAGNPAIANGLAANVISDDAWTNIGALPVNVVYTVVPVNGTCGGTPFTITVTVNPEPVYSNATPPICSDGVLGLDLSTLKNGTGVSATTFNITSINSNGLVASAGVPVTGSGFTDLEISNDAWTNTTSAPVNVVYTIVPRNGTCEGTSFTVTVTVNPEPVYSNSTPTRCSDETININLTTLKVVSSVTATTFNITNIVDNGLVASAGSPAIANGLASTVIMDDAWTNTTAAPVNVIYTIVPRNGSCEGTSFTVTVTVNPEPVYADATPTVCSDGALGLDLATLKDALSISATTFNITSIVNNGLTASAGSPAIANGLASTILNDDAWTNTGALPVDVEYTIVPVNGTCLGTAFTITVTVDPEPVYSNATPTRCSDEMLNIDLATLKSGTGVNASIFNITNINANGLTPSAGTPATGTGLGAMEISNDAWTNTTALPVTVLYTIVPVNGTCPGTAFTVSVTINPEPVYSSTAPTLCSDDATGLNLSTLKAGTSVAATTFNITNIVSNGLVATAGNPTTANGVSATVLADDKWNNITANPVDVVYTIVPLNGSCAGTPFTVTLTVNPAPDYNGAGMTRCSDEVINFDLATLKNGLGVTATGFNITSINSNGLIASGGNPSTGINFGSLVLSDDSWTNTTANVVTVEYTIVPVAGTCQDTPLMVTVAITPEPVYSNSTITRCSDDLVGVNLSTLKNASSVTATAFNIISIATNGLTSSAGSPAIVTGVNDTEISDDRWTNTTLTPVNVIYTIVPVNSGSCLGTPFTVAVAVNPEPVGAPTTFIKCNEEQFNLNLISVMSAASVLPNTFNIAVNANGLSFAGTSPSQGTGKNANELFDDKWINTTPLPVDVTYDITPLSSNNCAGTLFTLTFTINPKPTAPAITTRDICSDGTFNFDLQTVVDNTVGGGNTVQSKFRYTVTSSNPAVSPASARNTPSDAVINDTYENRSNTNAVITYLVTPISDLGCEGASFEVRLTVFPEPVGINITDTNCITNLNHNIQTRHINAIGGNSLASIFTYTVGSSNSAAVPPAPNRVVASSALITDNYVNTSGLDVTITYTITPFNSAHPTCPGTQFTYAIVISSRPVGASATVAAACSDAAFSINPQLHITNGVTSTFSWTVTYDAGLTGPTSGSGALVTGSLTNNSTGVKNAYFLITPTSGSCSGVAFTLTQPVNPEPVIDPSVTPRTVCSDTPTNIVFGALAGTETPDKYDISLLSQDPDLVGTPTTGTALAANAIQMNSFTNRVRTQGLLVKYEVTPYGTAGVGACQGDKLIVQLEVLPEPVMLPSLANVSICSDVVNGIELDTDGIAITATNYFINSVNVQSTGSTLAPNTTVADVTSPTGNITADPSLITGARSKSFIRNDKFIVTKADGANNNNTVVYNVTPRSGAGCYGDPFNINLLVLPEPKFDPIIPPPACSDASIDLQLMQQAASPSIAQYNVTGITWQSGLLPGNSNIAIGVTLPQNGGGNYDAINDLYTNASATPLTATYLIKPIAVASLGHSCEGDVVSAVVTISPSPQVLLNLDKIVCNEAVNGIVIGTEVSSAPAQSFQITRNALPAGLTPNIFAPGTIIINGASTNTIAADKVVNTTNDPLTATYTVRANTHPSGTGCYGPTEVISVVVEPQIRVTLTPGNTNNAKPNICSTDDTQITLISPSNPSAGNVTFNFSALGGSSGISGISPGSNLNENDIIEQALSNSSNSPIDVTYTVTPRANSAAGGNGCIGTPSMTVVKVEPKPKLTALPASRTVCEGVPLGIDFNTATVPSTGAASMFFQLTAVEDPNVIGAPANVSGFVTTYPTNYAAGTDVLNDVLVNSALDQQSLRYLFTPSFTIPSATCVGDPVAINVVVSPRPVMVPFTVDPKCSSETFAIDFASSVTEADPGSTLATWTYAYTPSGDPDLTGASNGAGYELSQVVFNKNAEAATVTYSIKAKAFGCESNVINVPVEVYPIPKITGVPRSVNVCDDAVLTVALNSTATNTQYTWAVDDELQADLSGAADQATPVNSPLSYIVSNAGEGLGNYTFEITPQIATSIAGKVCLGDPHTLIANIAPPLDGKITIRSTDTDQSFICQGTPEAIEFALDGLLFFDVTYKVGSTTVNLTRQSQHIAIPVNPTSTTQYELVSIKDGYGCVATINDIAIVTVYPKPDAIFNEGTVPPYVAGNALVTYTNTSVPFNPAEFSYEWKFGDQSSPKEYSGNDGVIPVNYSLPGFKEVVLVATNKAAKANGVECSDTFRKTIEIILPPLIAAFQINPLAACFPVDLTVTSNTSTGDTYKWQVIDQSGNIAATAQAPKPIFRIVNPGKYDVFLETSSSITNQRAFAQVNGIEVFDNPVASLEARPTTLFIPDTELTTFNFTTGANFYVWDFADGTTSEDFEPTHFYTLEGTYDIILVAGFDHGDKDINGDGILDGNVICYDSAKRQVIAKEGGLTKVPNAFTPNKEGPTGGTPGNGTFNDTFLPITKGVAREDGSFIMQIFDRWGTLIFESRNQNMGWDGYDRKGNLVPAGVYVYKLDLRLADGQRTTQIGDVTVIR